MFMMVMVLDVLVDMIWYVLMYFGFMFVIFFFNGNLNGDSIFWWFGDGNGGGGGGVCRFWIVDMSFFFFDNFFVEG